MWAVRSASNSASLAWASFSHCTSFVSRSFKRFASGISCSFLLNRRAAAVPSLLALDCVQDCLAAPVNALVELHRGKFGRVGGGQARDHLLGVQGRVALPRLIDTDFRAGAVLGARFRELLDEFGL